MAEEGQRDVFQIYVKFVSELFKYLTFWNYYKSVKLCCPLVWH